MSRFEARWAIFLTCSLLALSLPTNAVPTGLLSSTTPVSASATFNAQATVLSEESVASVHETACPSIVAEIASAVTTTICTTPIPIPGLTFASCSTYTTYDFPKSVYPPASCCNACSIQAPQVEVNFWAPEPTPTTPAPKTPYTLVSDGYTYTSPSVYVVFSDLYAQGDCTLYEQGQIGNNISRATVAYDPAALSTAPCVPPGESEFLGYEPINYADWYHPVPNSVEETRPGCFIPNTSGINPAGTNLAASPALSLPQGLSSLEPIWSAYGCQPDGREPAFAVSTNVLTKTTALAPSVQQRAVQTETAVPAAQLTPPIVTSTVINSAQPTD